MSGRVVYLNGRYVPEAEAKISIFDSALVLGDMAFESTRTFQGEPFELRTHLERLLGTLEILQIDCGLNLTELGAITRDTLDRNRATESAEMEWQIVHNISPGTAEMYRAAFARKTSPTISINCWPLISQLAKMAGLYQTGVRLVIPAQRVLPPEIINPRAKTRSRVHAKLAQLQASAIDPSAWAMLLDRQGFLAEGPSWNIFLVKEGRLLTPTTRNVLPGVSRTITLQLAQELGIICEEKDITPDEAMHAEEMFCTATSFCLVHVNRFGGTNLGDGQPGPITQQLAQAWQEHVSTDFIAQAQQCVQNLPAWLEKEHA